MFVKQCMSSVCVLMFCNDKHLDVPKEFQIGYDEVVEHLEY